MLEAYLASLTKRQSMLLLTAVTFGGQGSLAALEHLPPAEAALLKHRAAALLALPREQRIPMLVQEMKRLVTPRRGQLWATQPEQLAQLMLRERAALRQVLLKALPSGLADSVRHHIPPERSKLPREARPEVLSIVRGKLEEILARATPEGASFKFADVLLLHPRELVTLIDEIGLRHLSPALTALDDAKRAELLNELPPDQQERVFRMADLASGQRRLHPQDALQMLGQYLVPGQSPVEMIRNAGAQRLTKALLAQSVEFAHRVVERNPGDIGAAIIRWMKQEKPKAINRGDGGRTDIVTELERLAKRGLVDRPLRPLNPAPPPPPMGTQGKPPPLRPPLLPPPRAQAAMRMAAAGIEKMPERTDKSARRAPRRDPPPAEEGTERSNRRALKPPPLPATEEGTEKSGRKSPGRGPVSKAKPQARGPKGRSG